MRQAELVADQRQQLPSPVWLGEGGAATGQIGPGDPPARGGDDDIPSAGGRVQARRARVTPSMPGISTSVTTRAISGCALMSSSASPPSAASNDATPASATVSAAAI